jgi:Trehalose utilisation
MYRLSLLVSLSLVPFLATAGQGEAPKKLLLIGQGPDGHPPGTHEYVAGLEILARCLKPVKGLEVMQVRADGPWREGPDLLERMDGAVLFVSEGARWVEGEAKRRQAFARLAARGGGLSVLHWGMGTKDVQPIAGFLELLGGCHGGPDRKYQVVEADVQIAAPGHPIVAGIKPFRIRDEFYYRLKFVPPEGTVKPVLRVPIDGKPETVAWAWERADGGRSFGFSGLHFHENWQRPEYRRLVAQGVLWTLKLPIPKDGLAVDGKP